MCLAYEIDLKIVTNCPYTDVVSKIILSYTCKHRKFGLFLKNCAKDFTTNSKLLGRKFLRPKSS